MGAGSRSGIHIIYCGAGDNMNAPSAPGTQLFVLRLWVEDLGDGRSEWRGQLKHLPTGETHYFRGWSQLQELFRASVPSFPPHPEATSRSQE
jgi:hypothetical protein